MTPDAKTQLVLALAREVGFDLAGVAPAGPVRRAAYYRQWLAAGYGGTMTYLERNVQSRAEPARLLPGTRSIICVAVNYKRADGYLGPPIAVAPPTLAEQPTGIIAQYARGYDYHLVLRRMMLRLVNRLRERLPEPFEARVFVDTAPILEKELAVAAGIGWMGKNTCLLNAGLGSYLLLGEIVSTLELTPDEPRDGQCGSCTRCLDACPADAFIGPYRLDASRCAAYLTIEHRGPIAPHLQPALQNRVFGCDACQQVCPYNARAPLGTHPEIAAELMPQRVNLLPLLSLRAEEHRRITRGSATRRASAPMWQRNAAIVLANLQGHGKGVCKRP
jgi:epoxyqueuosine reductase